MTMTGNLDDPNIRRSGREFRFPILDLAAELRVMVYWALWALPVSHRLITGLKSLTKTCRKIRDEVLHEYITYILPGTQIHLGSKGSVHKVFRGSPFMFQHIQHVSLLWGGCMCADDSYRDIAQRGDHPRGFRWLRKLPQLKSLELVFTDPSYKEMQRFSRDGLALPAPTVAEEEVDYQEFVDMFCYECRNHLIRLPPTLKKVVCRVWSEGSTASTIREIWDVTEWYRKRRTLEEIYREPRGMYIDDIEGVQEGYDVGESQSPTYQIKYHVGDVDVEWPLPDAI